MATTISTGKRGLLLGVQAILFACVLNMVVGVAFYHARKSEPGFSPFAFVFIRVLANFSCLLLPLLRGQRLPRLQGWRGHRALWLWGCCGLGTTTTFFFAISYSPVGVVNFLNSGSGVFIAGLAPLLAGQTTPWLDWLGIFGSLAGLFLLSRPDTGDFSPIGAALAIFSGLCSAVAYLMIARTRQRSYGAETFMLHWTTVSFLVYSAVLLFVPVPWPLLASTWAALLVAAFSAAWSQYLTTVAYTHAPASLVACLTYLGAVLSVTADTFLFGIHYPAEALYGAATVIVFGCFLPLWKRKPAP